MTIQSEDIKLLKSAVMADVPEGGGAMTGTEVVDGQSNNLFPDTSTDDRAAGRVRLRKVFGVVHTDNTDEALGASFAVLKPPADPLVHALMFESAGWADERDTAKEQIERYLVKGPRLTCRLFDTHYAGAIVLMLYQIGGADFPAPGDAIVLRSSGGVEQYVRLTKVTVSTGRYNTSEGGSVVEVGANVATCEIGQPLAHDFAGPPIARVVNESAYTQLYTTNPSTGTAFYGVKPLADAASVGDRSVVADGGIYSPLVPAATVEEPLIDIAPLTARAGLSRTAYGVLALPGVSLALAAGTVLRLPTAVEPGTLTMTHGGTTFAADADGNLKQGTTVVGSVDHKGRTITMAGTAPNYGTNTNTVSYKPATLSGAAVESDFWTVTTANQGLAWVYAFEPPPAPGTLTVSYMAQGRWYDLVDNGAGRIAGADSSYGSGTLNYGTGSMALTLGALPDVGSALILQWGRADAAVSAPSADLPTRLQSVLTLSAMPKPGTLVLEWSRGVTDYTASVAADGTVTGPALVGPVIEAPAGVYTCTFAPAVLPDGPVTATYEDLAASTAFTPVGGGQYQLTNYPIAPGSLRGSLPLNTSGYALTTGARPFWSEGSNIYAAALWKHGAKTLVGTVNNTTGLVTLFSTYATRVKTASLATASSSAGNSRSVTQSAFTDVTLPVYNTAVPAFSYQTVVAGGATTDVIPATWQLDLGRYDLVSYPASGLALTIGGEVYTSMDGSVARGWSTATGAGVAAGSWSSNGLLTISSLPASGANTIVWSNLAVSLSAAVLVYQGTYRVQSAPIKVGGFQQQVAARVGTAADTGVISGGDFAGAVDFQRGIVKWSTSTPVDAAALTYNAVFLQYLPLDATLLGLDTARLPLDGKVPIYRSGGQVIVHNTLTTVLPNPLTKGTVYSLGRERIAAVTVRQASGAKVPASKYTVDFDAGTITVPVPADIAGLAQPFTVHHRIEDELMVLRADISGKLDLVAGLTHNYPADTSYVSSKLRKGDLFARAHNYIEQSAWTGAWSDEIVGGEPLASFNRIDFPITTSNRGAITERWALIFTSATQVRVVGETVGQIDTAVSISGAIAPINPQTGAPYFTVPAAGWGGGWSVGNALRFNTAAAGSPAWVVLCVLQGPPSVASDNAVIAFRCDVDA
jgi:hypothetical protein